MKNVLITGNRGFIGKNLVVSLKRLNKYNIFEFDLESSYEDLKSYCTKADVIFHLAGVNRPERVEEYYNSNVRLTHKILNIINNAGVKPIIVFTSSTQATLDNPYGRSKKEAEDLFINWAKKSSSTVLIYRLPNVFGKWCRPNYNSAVATFCYNIARGIPIKIDDPARILSLVYIDDVVNEFNNILNVELPAGVYFREIKPVFNINIVELVRILESFKESKKTLILPDFNDPFIKRLYATYVSYLPIDEFGYCLPLKKDIRGELVELMKSFSFGQVFISRTRPGEIRGNHYHDTKVEKLFVIDGDAIIRFQNIMGNDVVEYQVSNKEFKIIDIPPGYAHSIKNIGERDLVVLFWANEVFDPERPDSHHLEVKDEKD